MTTSDSNPPTLGPRPEAQPVKWEQLTAPQQDAARRMWEMLVRYLDDPLHESRYARQPNDRWRRLLPAIDGERRNRILLIDGERGSGKTTLLLSMLSVWIDAARRADAEEPALPSDSGSITSLSQLTDPRGRLIPLRLLELRSVGRTAPLLPYFVMALVDVVDELAPEPSTGVLDPMPDDEGRELRHAWEALMRAATAPSQRAMLSGSNLAPETYAQELRQAGRGHLDLRQLAGEFFDRLCERFVAWQGWPSDIHPLFVIAIDDADMNPARALEAAELMDALYHPRLVFLIAGDSKLFYRLLRVHFLAALREPMQGLARHEGDVDIAGDNRTAAELARRFYDKLVPVQQRFTLPILSPRERVERLLESDVLRELPLPGLYRTFAELLRADRQRGYALPETIRELVDLRGGLASYPDEAPFRLLQALQQRQLDYGEDDREAVRLGLRHLITRRESDRPSEPSERWLINLDGFMGEIAATEYYNLDLGHGMTATLDTAHDVTVRASRFIQGEPVLDAFWEPEQEQAEHEKIVVTPEVAALWLLASEVYACYEPSMVEVSLTRRFRVSFGNTRVERDGYLPFETPWPRPFSSQLILRQCEIWRKLMSELLGDGEHEAADLLELVLGNLIIVLCWVDPPEPVRDRDSLWPTVMKRLAKLLRLGARRRVPRWICGEVLRVLFPESGLSVAAVERIIAAGRETLGSRFESMLVAAHDQRLRLSEEWARSRSVPLDALVHWLDALRPPVPGFEDIVTGPRRRLAAELLDALEQVELDHEDAEWSARTLRDYVTRDLEDRLRGADVQALELEKLTAIFRQAEHLDFRRLFGEAIQAANEEATRKGYRWPTAPPWAMWRDGRVQLGGSEVIGLTGGAFEHPRMIDTQQSRVQAMLLRPALQDATIPAVLATAIALAHDYAGDQRYARHVVAAPYWPLLSTVVDFLGVESKPWPTIEWLTRVDLVMTLDGWTHITEMAELSPATIGITARRFVAVHLEVYRARRVPTRAELHNPGTWQELVARARQLLVADGHRRDEKYRTWFESLIDLAVPWAGLGKTDVLELLFALHDAGQLSHGTVYSYNHRFQANIVKLYEPFPGHPWVRVFTSVIHDKQTDIETVMAQLREP